MVVREEHPSKAQLPIVVTPSGMVMVMRSEGLFGRGEDMDGKVLLLLILPGGSF